MRKVSLLEWLALAVIVAAGFVLRSRELAAFKLSPDDGQYMYSARLQSLERSTELGRWIEEDRAWIAELVEDWGHKVMDATTYQHSYLHQFLLRYGYRLGLARIEALRMNAAVLGALTAFALWWIYALVWPERRRVGLVAAGIVSMLLVHVFQSRTGWGQIGTAFFFCFYLALGFQLLVRTEEHDTRRQLRLALAMALVSVLGMGFHELTSVLVVGMCVLALASPWWAGPGRRVASRRVGAVLISAVPAGAYTLCLYLFSGYAKDRWLTNSLNPSISWLEMRRQVLDRFWNVDQLHLQISLPVLALALIGMVSVRRRERIWFRYLVGWILAATVPFFFLFENPTLLRIYLPVILILVLFAAEGLVALCERLGERLAPVATALAALLLVAFLGATSWTTLFGQRGEPFFCAGAYLKLDGWRWSDRHWLEYLEDHQVTAQLGVYPAKDPLFVALDHDFDARLFSFDEPQTTWTDYLLAVNNSMKAERRRLEDGGRYRLVAQDDLGRIGLYVLEPRAQ